MTPTFPFPGLKPLLISRTRLSRLCKKLPISFKAFCQDSYKDVLPRFLRFSYKISKLPSPGLSLVTSSHLSSSNAETKHFGSQNYPLLQSCWFEYFERPLQQDANNQLVVAITAIALIEDFRLLFINFLTFLVIAKIFSISYKICFNQRFSRRI